MSVDTRAVVGTLTYEGRITDFGLHDGRLVVAEIKTDATGRRSAWVNFHHPDEFGLMASKLVRSRPAITSAGVFEIHDCCTDADLTPTIVTEVESDDAQGLRFQGLWPRRSAVGCKCRIPEQRLSDQRYFVDISECGLVRIADFVEQRLFYLPPMGDFFGEPQFSLSDGHLYVQGPLVNANRGAGDGGRPICVYDLDEQKWQGRLQVRLAMKR